ncbi:MAG: PAS domain S-box protein [Burkholderiaceae bacterium]
MKLRPSGQQFDPADSRRTSAEHWSIVSALPMPVVMTDAEDRILHANPACCKLLGYSEDELRSIDCAGIVHRDDQTPRLLRLAQLTGGAQDSLSGEWRCRRKDGSFLWVRANMGLSRSDDGPPSHVIVVLEDIARSRAMEEQLQDSGQLLRIAGHMAGLGGWSMELPDGPIHWTDECAAIHDELPGFSPSVKEASKYYIGRWRDRFYEGLTACAVQGTAFDEEVQIITASGRRVWLRTIGQAVRDGSGRITRMQGAFLDITARKLAADESETRARQQAGVARLGQLALSGADLAKLREEAARVVATALGVEFSSLLELMPDDRALRFVAGHGWEAGTVGTTTIAASAETLAGFALVSKKPLIIEDFDTDARFERSELLRQHAVASGIVVLVGAPAAIEGVLAAFSRQKRLFTTDDVHFFQGVANVVSQASTRMRAQGRLQLQAAVIENMAEGVVVADAFSCIESTNSALDAMFGCAPGALVGQHLARLRNWNNPNVRDAVEQTRRHVDQHARWQGVVTRQKFDGTPFVTQTQIGAIDMFGERHFFAVLDDITQRQRDQEALRLLNVELETRVQSRTVELERSRHEAEQANQAKSLFLATMSHEIRTPVNGVIGMIEVLQQTSLQQHQADMVDLIRQSADALLTIVNDILDLSKIEAGKIEIEHAPMVPAELVRNVCDLSRHLADNKRVALQVHIDPDLPERVLGDAGRTRQVLFNLISNAIKFSSGEHSAGWVSVRASAGEQVNGKAGIELQIADNGIGMDQATLARLFTPFTQADASTTRRYGGTGLGLAISRNLLRLMGGTIDVQSAIGRGSVFTVRLECPLAPAQSNRTANVPPPVPTQGLAPTTRTALDAHTRSGKHRLLVAEDNETNQKVILHQLQLLGHAATLAADGAQALQIWRAGGVGLVLTDLHMPVMDGYELAAAIRREEGEDRTRVPIVALTANALRSEADRCRQAGMDDCVTKPASLARLRDTLARWLPENAAEAGLSKLDSDDISPPTDVAQALDITVLTELVGDNRSVVHGLLRSFSDSSADLTRALQQACDAHEWSRVPEIAHKLKSSARSIGALGLGDICAELEATAATASPQSLEALRARFDAEAVDARCALTRLLAEYAPTR